MWTLSWYSFENLKNVVIYLRFYPFQLAGMEHFFIHAKAFLNDSFIQPHTHITINTHTHTHTHIYVCVCVCVCVCVNRNLLLR